MPEVLLQLNASPLPAAVVVDCAWCNSRATTRFAREVRRGSGDGVESAWLCTRRCRDQFLARDGGWTEIAL